MALLTLTERDLTIAKFAKINERAERRGLSGRFVVESEEIIRETENEYGFKITETLYETTITGEAPRYRTESGDEWELAAVLDFDPDAGLIVRTAPGVDTVDRSTLRAEWCDYCKTRRDRRNTYLVRKVNGDGGGHEQLQVGSTCIKDFLGWSGSVVWLDSADGEREMSEIMRGGYAEPRWTPATVLAIAYAAIKANGWAKSDSYDKTPTRQIVASVLMPNPYTKLTPRERAELDRLREYAAEASERAETVRQWIMSDAFAGGTEFVINMKALCAAATVGPQHIGMLAYAPQAYIRATERAIKAEQERAELINEYYGEAGGKIDSMIVEVRNVNYSHGYFGGRQTTTTIYSLVALYGPAKGHVFTWFSTNGALGDERGARFTIAATIKGYDLFRGSKKTILTRAKVLTVNLTKKPAKRRRAGGTKPKIAAAA